MPERDVIKNTLDFAFIVKGQLQSDRTTLMRSLLTILIMECEDLIHDLDEESITLPHTGEHGTRAQSTG